MKAKSPKAPRAARINLEELESPPLTEEMLSGMKPFNAKAEVYFGRGRPKSEDPSEPVSLRIKKSTLTKFKASGAGWQTRMNAALDKAAARMKPAKRV
jgi:uncharacterized protein (DUF4415 family)